MRISIPDFSQKLDYQAIVNPFSKRQQLARAMKPAPLSERTCLPRLSIQHGVEAISCGSSFCICLHSFHFLSVLRALSLSWALGILTFRGPISHHIKYI